MLAEQVLEDLADHLLMDILTDKKRNKSKSEEYPILSNDQLKRRHAKEIPYSNLSIKQRISVRAIGYIEDCDGIED